MRLLLENLPPSLAPQRETLARCLVAMNGALPLRAVYLFGSHARGAARADSDVDLCLVAEGAERQLMAAQNFRRAMWDIKDKPAFTLMPIAPQRLEEKKAIDDHFFGTVLSEGVLLAGAFENRAHFFGAAAEAMRRILVESARRKLRGKRGSGVEHVDVDEIEIAAPMANENELLAVHEALDRLAASDARKAELVKLRYFAGLSFEETAEVLGISVPTAHRDWAYARAWLHQEIGSAD